MAVSTLAFAVILYAVALAGAACAGVVRASEPAAIVIVAARAVMRFMGFPRRSGARWGPFAEETKGGAKKLREF